MNWSRHKVLLERTKLARLSEADYQWSLMLRFKPQYKSRPWGGRRLADEFGRRIPDGPIGESWELSDFGEHRSVVAAGPQEGKRLGELWSGGLLGGSAEGEFPFLLKWLDTADKLSVQVHPDQHICRELADARPKTEAWCIARSTGDATMLLGHYPGLDPSTLAQAAKGGTIQKWMYETRPQAGEMILVKAGTLHAIGGGFLVLEVQQPSDTTFRVYDWQRLGLDGHPRALHLEEAAKSVDYERWGPARMQRREIEGPCFRIKKLRPGTDIPPTELRVLVADEGPLSLKHEGGLTKMDFGDVVVAEVSDGPISTVGAPCLWVTEVSGGSDPSTTGEQA